MCGIIGVLAKQSALSTTTLHSLVKELLLLSESRGKEASGIAYATSSDIRVYNTPQPASLLIQQPEYKKTLNLYNNSSTDPIVCIGHARLVTNGSMEYPYNNQPVVKEGIVGIHNGIIVNDEELWKRYPHLKRQYDVDTEVALSILRHELQRGITLDSALQNLYRDIRGTASFALLFEDRPELVLTTNNGSLYLCRNTNGTCLFFASERHIAEKVIERFGNLLGMDSDAIVHVQANEGYIIDPARLDIHKVPLTVTGETKHSTERPQALHRTIVHLEADSDKLPKTRDLTRSDLLSNESTRLQSFFGSKFERATQIISALKRCTRCVLPETMPFIAFDHKGVCNYCRTYTPIIYQGVDALRNRLMSYAATQESPSFVVCLSGGRDSSYGLHYFKKILGMNVVAYSYDWGMVTDLARRNQARMCGTLGVEHILVSADIRKKRNNIRMNVLAWLRKPNLGTIPLFMAGDKQYFYYANKVLQQTRSQNIVMSENSLERTHFKHGFCNISHAHSDRSPYFLSIGDKMRLASYYAKQFITNPHLINSSIIDTLGGYLSYYFIPHNYLYTFGYLPWIEEEINSVLIKEYDWETASDTESTWRIGDGTAPFYNYIYYLVAGFTENDTFRSNQIREGILDRSTALTLVQRDNKPRYVSIDWYCKTIAVDTEKTLRAIHLIRPLYDAKKIDNF